MQRKFFLLGFVILLLAQMVYADDLYSAIIGEYNFSGRRNSVMPPAKPTQPFFERWSHWQKQPSQEKSADFGKVNLEKTSNQNKPIDPFRWERWEEPPPPPPPRWEITLPILGKITINKPSWWPFSF